MNAVAVIALLAIPACADGCAVPIRQPPVLDMNSELAHCQERAGRLQERVMARDMLLYDCYAKLGRQPTCGARP